MRRVLRQRDFRFLWLGQGISLLGDQFYLIALPWLTLQLTGDALAVGTVMALELVPTVLFMLLGGALIDRFSPRALMLGSNAARMLLVGLLAPLVFQGWIALWLLYAFALLFGLADAFFLPASQAIVPQLVDRDHLQAANSLMGSTGTFCFFVGPALAGLLISLLTGESAPADAAAEAIPNSAGIGVAFAIDAATFLASLVILYRLQARTIREQTDAPDSILSSIRAGLAHVWQDRTLRAWFTIIPAFNILFSGPVAVGIPVLADARLPEGAAAYGLIMSAFGGGMMLGTLSAGLLPKPAPRRMAPVLLTMVGIVGITLTLLGFARSTPLAMLSTAIMGVAGGYADVQFISWLQARTPAAMQGRVMSLMMLAFFSSRPISFALAGAALAMSITGLFVVAGGLATLVPACGAFSSRVRAMDAEAEADETVSETEGN